MKRIVYFFLAVALGIVLFILWYFWYWQPTGRQTLNSGHITYTALRSSPEATLYYPQAEVFSPFGQSQRGKETVAFAGAILTSNDSPEKIYQWYNTWLTSHGWKENRRAVSGLTDTQLSIKSYTKDTNKVFYVAINNPQTLTKTLGKAVPENKTVFEIRYIVQ
jgi:hypothetical protein